MFQSDQKRAFLAVILSGLILFGWQFYFAPKPTSGDAKSSSTSNEVAPVNNNSTVVSSLNPAATGDTTATALQGEPAKALSSVTLSNKDHSFVFNSDLSFTSATNTNSVFPFFCLS